MTKRNKDLAPDQMHVAESEPPDLMEIAISRLALLTKLTSGLYQDETEQLDRSEMNTLLTMLDDITCDLISANADVTKQLNAAYDREHPEVAAARAKAGAR